MDNPPGPDENELVTERLVLRYPTVDDGAGVSEYRGVNRIHLSEWEPLRADSFYTISEADIQVRSMRAQIACGDALHWLIRRQGDSEIIGLIGFTNIVRGPFQACHLGFSLGYRHQGEGLMFEALTAAIAHLFEAHGLHRIMANYQPNNVRSQGLLHRLGFVTEGLAKSYLKINGHWADHVLTSLLSHLATED